MAKTIICINDPDVKIEKIVEGKVHYRYNAWDMYEKVPFIGKIQVEDLFKDLIKKYKHNKIRLWVEVL